jgi:hypothetical protein
MGNHAARLTGKAAGGEEFFTTDNVVLSGHIVSLTTEYGLMSTATLDAPAERPKVTDFEKSIRDAIAAVRKAQAATAPDVAGARPIGKTMAAWWLALFQLCRAYSQRPMPGRFARLGGAIEQLLEHLRDRFGEFLRDNPECELGDVCDGGGAAEILDVFDERFERCCLPPSKQPTFEEYLQLPNISLANIKLAFPDMPDETIKQKAEAAKVSLRGDMGERRERRTRVDQNAQVTSVSENFRQLLETVEGQLKQFN